MKQVYIETIRTRQSIESLDELSKKFDKVCDNLVEYVKESCDFKIIGLKVNALVKAKRELMKRIGDRL